MNHVSKYMDHVWRNHVHILCKGNTYSMQINEPCVKVSYVQKKKKKNHVWRNRMHANKRADKWIV